MELEIHAYCLDLKSGCSFFLFFSFLMLTLNIFLSV